MGGLLDLLPSDESAVAAGQGANNILNDRYKQALSFMQLEQSMMKASEANKQGLYDDALLHSKNAANTLQMLQKVNFKGPSGPVDLQHPDEWLNKRAEEGIISDSEVGLEKATAQAMFGMNKNAYTQEQINERSAADRGTEMAKQTSTEATKLLAWSRDNLGNVSMTSTPKRKGKVVGVYKELKGLGDTPAMNAFFNKYEEILSEAGEARPGRMKAQGVFGATSKEVKKAKEPVQKIHDGWVWEQQPDGSAKAIKKAP